jgi:hypothetical protein
MTITIKNDRYVDENENSWNVKIFTKKTASELSDVFLRSNCFNMMDCSGLIDCSNLRDCSYLRDCSGLRDCSNLRNCSNLRDCSLINFGYRIINTLGVNSISTYITPPIGSRDDQTYFYYTKDWNMVRCGCFWGTLEEFKNKVHSTYPDGEYREEYDKQIKIMEEMIL